MNKLLVGTLLAFVSTSSFADDLKVADDFKSGDLVSADTFNQIFDTIEKINRTVVDTDLIGVWSCDAMTTRNTSGWTSKSLFYVLENAQVNLTASSASTSLESPYSISTSNPSPFKREGAGTPPFTGAFSATYTLHKNKLFTKYSGDGSARIWDVNIVSPSRFELTFLETSATSFPASYASFITCDSAEAVPASPTAPTATNNKTGINLAWTDSSSDETGFKVYRKLSTETEAKLIATQTAVTFSDTDLTEGQTAYYQVVAYNDNGESAKSKTVSGTRDSTVPSIINVTPIDGSSLVGSGSFEFTITFSEPIKTTPRAGAGSSLMYAKINGEKVEITYGGTDVLVTSVSQFLIYQSSSTYEITIDKGWVTDANSLGMESDYTWTFSTP